MIIAGYKNNVKYRRSIVNGSILLTLTIVLMPIMGVYAQAKIQAPVKDSISARKAASRSLALESRSASPARCGCSCPDGDEIGAIICNPALKQFS